MKAELVADSVEANPFPYKAKTNERAKRNHQEKTFAAKLQSIHFLPPQQIVRQTSRAFPAIIPVHGWKTTQMNPVGKGALTSWRGQQAALDSLRCQLE